MFCTVYALPADHAFGRRIDVSAWETEVEQRCAAIEAVRESLTLAQQARYRVLATHLED